MQKILKTFILILLVLIPVFVSGEEAENGEQEKLVINWLNGPKKAEIGKLAEIQVPKGYHFAAGDDTRKIMEYYGNQPTDRELGYIAPVTEDWFMLFEFDETGYVKDDDKDSLDADAILKSIDEGNKEANKWRKENGMEPLEVTGWYKEPAYDTITNNVEWYMCSQ
ncbi:MAG: DUF2167 domain-containing protein [Spirochaetes bacterium]|nr:DUF2167 domain-containing protein [Spirochaetota bacterium]